MTVERLPGFIFGLEKLNKMRDDGWLLGDYFHTITELRDEDINPKNEKNIDNPQPLWRTMSEPAQSETQTR